MTNPKGMIRSASLMGTKPTFMAGSKPINIRDRELQVKLEQTAAAMKALPVRIQLLSGSLI
ncbi:hypothetical protein ES703_100705 [subsurface metagenome]